MLEIIFLMRFGRSLSKIAKEKGRSGGWAALGVLFWFGAMNPALAEHETLRGFAVEGAKIVPAGGRIDAQETILWGPACAGVSYLFGTLDARVPFLLGPLVWGAVLRVAFTHELSLRGFATQMGTGA